MDLAGMLIEGLDRQDRAILAWTVVAILVLVVAAPLLAARLDLGSVSFGIGLLQMAVLAAMLFGIVSGVDQWTGELSRLIALGAFGALMVLIGEIVSFLSHHVLEAQELMFLGAASLYWHDLGRLIGVMGFAIVAYMFYEFSETPWFSRQELMVDDTAEDDDG